MNKKGEITTQQLVMIIVLIVSFAVILFFLVRLNLQSTSDKEICHNSVVLKSKSKNLVGKLDCNTNYLCISGGNDCEGITTSETVKVDATNKNEIMKAIADEMADCWWMFGEGEVDYLSIDEKQDWKYTCGLCSVVKFDDKIISESEPITYREFYEYLNILKYGDSETYFTYLYDTSNVDEFLSESPVKIDIDNSYLISDEKYAIVTGHRTKVLFFGHNYLPPHYLKLNQVSSSLNCIEYVTKA